MRQMTIPATTHEERDSFIIPFDGILTPLQMRLAILQDSLQVPDNLRQIIMVSLREFSIL
jgi:hypothetical protein